MSLKPKYTSQAELKHLWGGFVPSLTPEQTELSVKLWHKIEARKQFEQELASSKGPFDSQ